MATVFEKVWAFDLNRAYTPASALDLTRYTMWLLAAQLTGNIGGLTQGLWTLYASSDSVTAGIDSTDRWALAGPYNGAKIVRGATTAVHSWIVLVSPVMNGNVWYLVLDFNTSADTSIRVSFCKVAPTGGSITVTPTSIMPGQWWPNSSSGAGLDKIINAGAVDNSRFNLGLTSVGDWYFLGCKQGSGVPNLCIQFHALSNKKTNDLFPVWSMIDYKALGVNRYGAADSCFDYSSASSHRSPRFDGINVMQAHPIAVFGVGAGAGMSIWKPTVADAVDGTFADTPCWIMTGSAPDTEPTSIRGRVADLAVCPYSAAALPEASVSPVTGSIDSSKAGNLWFPANSAFNFG